MEERFDSKSDPSRQRSSQIPRKPVAGRNIPERPRPTITPAESPVIPSLPLLHNRRSVESSNLVQYEPYQSPVEEPPATFQYIPYRRQEDDVPSPLRYVPYRAVTEAIGPSGFSRPFAGRINISRRPTTSSVRRESRASMSDVVSPVSPISERSHFRTPSTHSVDEIINSVSLEVSQYQTMESSYIRMPLSPLMELSAQEAAYRNSIHISSPVGSILRSRAATLASLHQNPKQRSGPRIYLGEEPVCDWLPLSLRWPFLLFVFIFLIVLAGVVLALTILSQKYQGLGQVQESRIFIFAWRFTPTILAAIYSLLPMAIAKDIKRTEPFSRLSRPDGSSAEYSLFLKFRSLWFDPFHSLSKQRNQGFRNWALFWASLVNLLALLIIIPFSSAFLSPREVAITRGSRFSRLTTNVSGGLQLYTDDSVLFRTSSSILFNTTTSAWISNDFAVLPFWPSGVKELPAGAALSTSNEKWTARTTVYQSRLDCSPMTLQSFGNYTLSKRLPTPPDFPVYELIDLTSFVLQSQDGCSLGFAGYPAENSKTSLYKTGGGWWAGPPSFSYPSLWNPGNGTFEGLNATNQIMLNSSSQCGDRSMFIFATPYKQGDYFHALGQVCKSSYYSADIPVTVSNSGTSSSFKFDEILFNMTRAPVDSKMFDVAAFENGFLTQDWSSKFQFPRSRSTPTLPVRPRLGGPMALLSAQNGFDLATMSTSAHLVNQARHIKQRFFGESMQLAFQLIKPGQATPVTGEIAVIEQRIVVSLGVGIVLMTALLLSSLLTGLVIGYTRLHERPLNLLHDPSSVKALASLISSGQNTRPLFEGLDTSSEISMRKSLSRHIFYLRHGVIYSYNARDTFQDSPPESATQATYTEVNSKNWRPHIIRGWILSILLISLTTTLVTVGILFSVFRGDGIAQIPFVSNTNINDGDSALTSLAPYSILPTLAAVCVMVWWSSFDQTFRRLQPYVSMAQKNTPSSGGIDLSYVNTPIMQIVGKAALNRHFLLALIAFGALLSQILIVSMAALWDRSPGFHTSAKTVNRKLELRTVPAIFSVATNSSNPKQDVESVLANIYGNSQTDWLYRATAEAAYNSTPSPWTSQDWAFVPLDLESVRKSPDKFNTGNAAQRASVTTPSLRGYLECTPIDMSNVSAWLTALDFMDKRNWNDVSIPSDLETGFELKLGLSLNQSLGDGRYKYWDENNPYFSFFATEYRLDCCGSDTNGNIGEAAIGYWSQPSDSGTSIIVKWITGHPFAQPFIDTSSNLHWVWRDIPQITALNCTPAFETVSAEVDVDLKTGIVQDYTIVDTPHPDSNAWAHSYQQLNASKGVPYKSSLNESGYEIQPAEFVHNVSVSYGYLFHDALLGAANSARIGNNALPDDLAENLRDRTFNFRMAGLNVDFMSYTSLALVGNNKSALLDSKILANVSSTVFSTFFKHFVQAPVSPNSGLWINGSWVTQPRGNLLPSDLGTTLDSDSTFYLQNTPSDTPVTDSIVISTRAMTLRFNTTAVILSLCILFFMITTSIFIGAYHKFFLKLLPRDVDTLGSVLGFVYGSERLLKSAADMQFTHSNPRSKSNREIARMGWFNGNGRRRWGIEILDERETQACELPAIEDVDPARLESLGRGDSDEMPSRPMRQRAMTEQSIDDFYGAYNTMATRTPPIPLLNPPIGRLAVKYY